MIIKSIPTGYFRDFQDLKMILKSSFDLVISTVEMLKGIFSTLKIKKERMKRAIDESLIQALDLAELLVQEYNIPFRQSHNIVAQLVKNSESPEDMLNKEKIEEYIFRILNKKITLSENLIQTLKNLDLCLEKRVSQGSPAKNEVKINIEELGKSKEILYKLYSKRIEKIGKSKALREEIIKDLLT